VTQKPPFARQDDRAAHHTVDQREAENMDTTDLFRAFTLEWRSEATCIASYYRVNYKDIIRSSRTADDAT